MVVIVNYPTTEEGMKVLGDRVAKAHAQSVIAYLNKLPISKQEKLDLLDRAMKRKYGENY